MIKLTQKVTAFCAVMFFVVISLAATSCDFDSKVIKTTEGLVRGFDNGDSWSFKGMPYAAPPVGELRWQSPQDPEAWCGVRDADEFCSNCPQADSAFGVGSVNEDCLYLNVTTPKKCSKKLLPVMVWIHGGAFISGSGSDAGYDATRLVQEDVIVVTLNYRIGALGFLPHPVLTAVAGESGNLGIQDQQKALKWVKANIKAFGGDPNNVTIFGESAGGHSVLSHLVAPGSQGLFDKAIVESGAYQPTQIPLELAYYYFGYGFAARAGCTATDPAEILAFLQNMTVEEVLAAQGDDWYVPTTGGSVLPLSIYEALATGQYANVPVISGCNMNEGRLFVALDMANGIYYNTEDEYVAGVATFLAADPRGIDAIQVAADYLAMQDPANFNKYRLALSKLWTDYMFAVNNYLQWNQLSVLNNVYAYWFTDDEAPNSFSTPYLEMDATHTLEIQYVFGTVGANGGSEEQIALSEEMVGYWTTFAKTGVPGETWAPFAAGDYFSYVQKLDTPSSAATALEFINANNAAYWAAPPLVASE